MMNPTLLLVDDDPFIGDIIKMFLDQNGFSVTLAVTVEQALQSLQDAPFQAILTDNDMPGMRGRDMIKAARKIQPTIAAFILSGSPPPDSSEGGVWDEWFVKGSSMEEIGKEILRHCAKRNP
jgi:CheY-like chemotaxis protein